MIKARYIGTGIMLVWAAALSVVVTQTGCDRAYSDDAKMQNAPQIQTRKKSAAGYDLTRLSAEEQSKLAEGLTAEEKRILLRHGTEPPFCGTLLDNKKEGTYVCRLCGLPLYSSKAKFNSGTGWPSFYEGYDPDHIAEYLDRSYGMVRVEIRCRRCDGHLGHVFDDGPPPTGRRHCLNSASLEFVEKGQPLPRKTKSDQAMAAESKPEAKPQAQSAVKPEPTDEPKK